MNLLVCFVVAAFGVKIAYSQEYSCAEDDIYKEFMQTAKSNGLDLFAGADAVLRYLRENETTNPLAQSILHTYQRECIYMADVDVPDDLRRKPFIVIEGNHRPSREVVGMRLTKMMGGRFLIHPAPCLAKYLNVVPKRSLLRRAFYMLSLYAQSFNAKVHLSLSRTVVLNGYWLDQLVFHLLHSFRNGSLPPAFSDVFAFPKGLLQPDVIFYLDIPDGLRQARSATTRSPLNWKPRALQLYKALQVRYPIVFDRLTGVYRTSTKNIYQYICHNLAHCRSIWTSKSSVDFDYEGGDGVMYHNRSLTDSPHPSTDHSRTAQPS